MTKEEAQKEITRLVGNAKEALTQAENYADSWGISFNFSAAYGMGGTYYPVDHGMSKDEAIDLVRTNGVTDENREKVATALEEDGNWHESREGWVSSSDDC